MWDPARRHGYPRRKETLELRSKISDGIQARDVLKASLHLVVHSGFSNLSAH